MYSKPLVFKKQPFQSTVSEFTFRKCYGVDNETGKIFPLKNLLPVIAKFEMKFAICSAETGALQPGKASSSILVCAAPNARQFTFMFSFLNSSVQQFDNFLMLGDKVYLSAEIKLDLFTSANIHLETPMRVNQKN